ncbi:MAG TPA: BMP family ABC transporter substrate-binding protein, partial [Chloroflexi bacterium]|nr:BMP family ABC transporter substrate-binding protein [Chloroflexota bacterium]
MIGRFTYSTDEREEKMSRTRILTTCGIAILMIGLILIGVHSAQADPPQAPNTIRAGLVTDIGTLADQSFNWFSYQGLLRAESELGVTGAVYTSTSAADYLANLQQCVNDGNDLCISVGFPTMDAISTTAAANPGMRFACVDCSWESTPPNLRGMQFDEQEAGYLAGTL